VRQYNEYNEERLGGSATIGRRFGSVWSGSITARGDQINISDVSNYSILDLRQVEGDSMVTGLAVRLRRSTLNSGIKPSSGTRLDLGAEQVGALGGDYSFTKLAGGYSVYFTIGEDYLGRKTTLHLRNNIAYIPQGISEAPIFERFFLGGRDFRGFKFRGVSPRGYAAPSATSPFPPYPGIPANGSQPYITNDPSGGAWSFFAGAEIERPLLAELLTIVFFVDSGTVTETATLDQYRVAVGSGLRVYVPALGPAPLAFDFGFPIMKQDGDQTRVFSFSLDIPF
jgi:outer membrane protein insertion porin family